MHFTTLSPLALTLLFIFFASYAIAAPLKAIDESSSPTQLRDITQFTSEAFHAAEPRSAVDTSGQDAGKGQWPNFFQCFPSDLQPGCPSYKERRSPEPVTPSDSAVEERQWPNFFQCIPGDLQPGCPSFKLKREPNSSPRDIDTTATSQLQRKRRFISTETRDDSTLFPGSSQNVSPPPPEQTFAPGQYDPYLDDCLQNRGACAEAFEGAYSAGARGRELPGLGWVIVMVWGVLAVGVLGVR